MRQTRISRFLSVGILICMINCIFVLPVMAFSTDRGSLDIKGQSIGSLAKSSPQLIPLSGLEKSKLIATAEKHKKFSSLEKHLEEMGYTTQEEQAYESLNDDSGESKHIFVKTYTSSTGEPHTLIYMQNLKTGEVIILEIDLASCAVCLTLIMASTAALIGLCTVGAVLTLDASCALAVLGVAGIAVMLKCNCAKCGCSEGGGVTPGGTKEMWCNEKASSECA